MPIDNPEQYRVTLEALADVEVQLAAVDETLCNLPAAIRDVMRRALGDNADLLREELEAYAAEHGPIAAPVPPGGPTIPSGGATSPGQSRGASAAGV